MPDIEPPAIREARVAAFQQEWAQTLDATPTPDQLRIIELGARFMTGKYGRPGQLFDKNVGRDQPFELRYDDYRGIPPSRENHQFVARFAIHEWNRPNPDIKQGYQLISLISDLDLVLGDRTSDPYEGEFTGVFKFYHSDFADLRRVVPAPLKGRLLPPRPWLGER